MIVLDQSDNNQSINVMTVVIIFKINGDLLRVLPTVLENLQRLDLSLFPKELERYKACCSG